MIRYPGLLLLALGFAGSAVAETTLCTEITSLPATIGTAGVYCLKQDLTTAITQNAAIAITSNNVTLDCNGHRIGGLAAGAGSNAQGIYASHRLNIMVRDCVVRGFAQGIWLAGSHGGGHVVEDNRLDGNLVNGIVVAGDGSRVRRNRVLDTGGNAAGTVPAAIVAEDYGVDILDNLIQGVTFANGIAGGAYGIRVDGFDGRIVGNHIGGLVPLDSEMRAIAIDESGRVDVRDNTLRHTGAAGSIAIFCHNSLAVASGNTVLGFAIGIFPDCVNGHDNDVH